MGRWSPALATKKTFLEVITTDKAMVVKTCLSVAFERAVTERNFVIDGAVTERHVFIDGRAIQN